MTIYTFLVIKLKMILYKRVKIMLEKVFDSGKIRLNYVETNPNSSDISLLLLHGGTARWQTFSTILPNLEKLSHVYAVDLRGHGKSGRGDKNYRLKDYMEDIFLFLKKHVNKPTLIFGHSLGGMVSLMMAVNHPTLVTGVIIGDSPFSMTVLKEGSMELMKWRDILHSNQIALTNPKALIKNTSKLSHTRTHLVDEMITNLTYMDPDVLTAMIDRFEETYAGYQVDKLLRRIRCPVLLLQGNPELGGVVRDKDVQKALEISPNLQHKKIKNAGHTLHLENKEEVLAVIEPFIKAFK